MYTGWRRTFSSKIDPNRTLNAHVPLSTTRLRTSYLAHEFAKPDAHDFTMGEYSEKVIQFGYIVVSC